MLKNITLTIALTVASAYADKVDLFIVAGQSNAQGYMGDAKGFKKESADRKIPLFYHCPGVGSSNKKWIKLGPQAGRFPQGHFGPEISFARAAKKAGYNPAIFKYSKGATSVIQNWKMPGKGGMYDDMIKQLKLAKSQLESDGHSVTYKGFIWVQGESDAHNPAFANAYQKNLSTLLTDLKKETQSPNMPMLLGMDEQHPWVVKHPQVLQAQQNIAASSSNIETITMFGFKKADTTHLTPAALLLQGERIFSAYKNLVSKETFKKKLWHEKGGKKLNYRIFQPTTTKNGKSPLVLFLHGAGERGDDNALQLKNGVKQLYKYIKGQKIPAIIIAPQCPKKQQWVNVPWKAKSHTMPEQPSDSLRMATDLLNHYSKDPRVDTSRIYITGLSMGGYGTWDILSRNPNTFAAALPICGGADVKQADKIKNIPIWTAHGDKDRAVPVSRSRDIIKALRAAGATPVYSEFKGVGHNTWTPIYNNRAVLDWLFTQKKAK